MSEEQVRQLSIEEWEIVDYCPVCTERADGFQRFEQIVDQGIQLAYVICAGCGLVMQTPRPTKESLDIYYREAYRLQVQGVEGPTDKDLRVQAGRARFLAKLIRDNLDEVGAHLDIGSSSGALLRAIRGSFDCESIGIEPGETYRQYSQDTGLEVYPSLDALPDDWRGKFDLITLIHVLEHLHDPVGYLRKLWMDWLRPGGWLLIEVPNLLGHQALEFSHLYAFTPETIGETLRRSGFRVRVEKVHGEPRSPLLPLYVTMLATLGDESILRGGSQLNVDIIRRKRRRANLKRSFMTRFLPWITWKRLPAREGLPMQEGSEGQGSEEPW